MRINATASRRQAATPRFIMSSRELAMCPGLFRHISTKDQSKSEDALRLTYSHGDIRLCIQGDSLLSGFDLAILQALELIATGSGTLVDDANDVQAGLRKALVAPDADADLVGDLSYVCSSASKLLECVGLPVNKKYATRLYASLIRLQSVTLNVSDVTTPHISSSFQLLSFDREKGVTRCNAIHVALNPRLTSVLAGASHQDTRLSATELKALGTEYPARILHQRLCALVNDGTSRTFKASTLFDYLYPDDAGAQLLDTRRTRKLRADYAAAIRQRAALDEAVAVLKSHLGWSIEKSQGATEKMVTIKRPQQNWTYAALRDAEDRELAMAA